MSLCIVMRMRFSSIAILLTTFRFTFFVGQSRTGTGNRDGPEWRATTGISCYDLLRRTWIFFLLKKGCIATVH
jgi:hypothetical protein